ncbi:MAG: hypothetical protein JWO00_494, partial [Candidatus Parcubacteria bacterium]|nr:hypothetical protein [Candidatus Parcubacteria bacterium]
MGTGQTGLNKLLNTYTAPTDAIRWGF